MQDTKHTLQVIEDINNKIDSGELSLDGVGVVTLDVESMYKNMSEELGTAASKEYLNSRVVQGGGNGVDSDEMKVKTESILGALDLCIKNNFFKFNSKIYQQVGGVGTGVKLAPPFACLGMGKFEDLAFSQDQELLERVLLWKRYIDDILMLFKGSRVQCQNLVNWLNTLMPGVVKFKFEYSEDKIEFLDLEIKIKNGKLETDLYVKPTNKQLFLDYFSNHPEH